MTNLKNRLYDFIYIGSFAPPYLINSSVANGRRGIDFATNNFQSNLIDCLKLSNFSFFALISPFFAPISNYYFSCPRNSLPNIFFLPFTSLPILRNIFEFFFVFLYLLLNFIGYRGSFIVFSYHSSFLLAVSLFKLITFSSAPICVVLDDLPTYMFSNSNIFVRFFKLIDSFLLRILSKSVTHYILLSSHMKSLDVTRNKYSLVLEGFSSSIHLKTIDSRSPIFKFLEHNKYFVYAGNLSPEKGVVDLIFAFEKFKLQNPLSDTTLLLAGSTSEVNMLYLNSLFNSQSHIHLLPPLSNPELSHLLNYSIASVVPTSPSEPFARYFFPSKLLHYMSHKSPVICLRLPCIPSEYFQFIVSPAANCTLTSIDQLAYLLHSIYNKTFVERDAIALRSQNFACSNKSSFSWSSLVSHFFYSTYFLDSSI